jgi:hypothetical protein
MEWKGAARKIFMSLFFGKHCLSSLLKSSSKGKKMIWNKFSLFYFSSSNSKAKKLMVIEKILKSLMVANKENFISKFKESVIPRAFPINLLNKLMKCRFILATYGTNFS